MSDDLLYDISIALGDYADDHDIDAIADELRDHGCKRADDIDSKTFWDIVQAHPATGTAATDPAQEFQAEITEALKAARPIGEPAVWRRGGVTVSITGAPRHGRMTWDPWIRIDAAIADGRTVTASGEEIGSPDALWALVSELLDEWTSEVAERREAHRLAARRLEELRDQLGRAERQLTAAAAALDTVLPGTGRTGQTMTAAEVAAYLGIAAGSVRKQMSRWDIEPVYTRSASGRPRAGYPAEQVQAKAAARPGQGRRTDLEPAAPHD